MFTTNIDSVISVSVTGNYAYVGDVNHNMRIVNITNPHAMVLAGSCSLFVNAVAISGNYAFVASGDSGLGIVDVSNPASPAFVSYSHTPGKALDIKVQGNYAYIADSTFGLQIVDITNPLIPANVGSCPTFGSGERVAVSGEYAYIADGYPGIQVISISNPASPSIVGNFVTFGAPDYRGVAVSGNYLYVADYGDDGISIADITDPTNPQYLGYNGNPHGRCRSVAISGNFLFVASEPFATLLGGLSVFDVTDPSAPARVGYYVTPGTAVDVALNGSTTFIADGNNLGCYDVSYFLGLKDTPSKLLPSNFILSEPYPNPFNPTTQIQFELAHNTHVNLQVFDALGRKVSTLADAPFNAGSYRLQWNGTGMASGNYFIRMSAAGQAVSKKITLLK